MENKHNIVNRIKKLLAMADQATPNEQDTAILLAQRLMAKHHISEVDVITQTSEEIITIVSNLNSRKVTWQLLAEVIANNFKSSLFTRGTKTYKRIVFVGYETDAVVCKEVYESAYHFIVRYSQSVASYYQRTTGTSKGIKDEWTIGFINGLDNGFKDQVSSSSEVGLMVLVPEEVKEFISSLDLGEDDSNPMVKRNGNPNIYNSGYGNGYQFANGTYQKDIEGN